MPTIRPLIGYDRAYSDTDKDVLRDLRGPNGDAAARRCSRPAVSGRFAGQSVEIGVRGDVDLVALRVGECPPPGGVGDEGAAGGERGLDACLGLDAGE